MMFYLQSAYPLLIGIPILLFAALLTFIFLFLSERGDKAVLHWRVIEVCLAIFTFALLTVTLVQKNCGALAYQGEPWLDVQKLLRTESVAPHYPLPLLPLGFVSCALFFFALARVIYLRRFRKPLLSHFSIKEGFDNLPSGGCFADKNGEIVLCNLQMHHLCQHLLGSDLQHLADLHEALENPPQNITCVDATAHIYRFPNETLWRFSEQLIVDADGISYRQIQAFDVTDLYNAEQALKRENAELTAANTRARTLYRELDALVHEEERLATQMQLHDVLGRQLLYSRKCLTENAPLSILRKIGDDWLTVVQLLQNGAEIHAPQDTAPQNDIAHAFDELQHSAHDIGVDIILQGQLPQDSKAAYLLLVAIRECTTNTARHALGSQMTVSLSKAQNTVTAAITNNGKIPQAPIHEGGGLTALRRRVECAGGNMTVQSTPFFELRITLPTNTGEEELL